MVEGGHLGFPRFSHVKPINVNKSASKSLRRSILVSKCTFAGSMNAVKMLGISVSDVNQGEARQRDTTEGVWSEQAAGELARFPA